MTNYTQEQIKEIKDNIAGKLLRHFGRTPAEASRLELYKAVSLSVRDELMPAWQESNRRSADNKSKVLYYLSLEFLMGRFLESDLLALGRKDAYAQAVAELGSDLSSIAEIETDAGLGNGGLGRLAACYMDTLATLDMPAVGCCIRYDYGLFRQKIVDGMQIELPDNWLENGCSWEIPRPEEQFEISYYGKVNEYYKDGRLCFSTENANKVLAVPYDIPVPGYGCARVNTLRAWSARSPQYLDMQYFGQGDYIRAVAERELAETISRMLYPNDSHNAGKSLRLQQQYFFSSATLQYMLKRHKSLGLPVRELPDYAAVQINDTHPAIAIAELMRLLMDCEGLGWDEAADICSRVFAYTNHTIMSEALEKWPCYLVENMLPRVYMIIKEIDRRFREKLPPEKREDMAVIAFSQVRMANLCMAVCNKVNGVSALHTDILKNGIFRDFNTLKPDQIINITNGITPRRWLMQANPRLADLLTRKCGDWTHDMPLIAGLEKYINDDDVLSELADIKRENKRRLAAYIADKNGITLNTDSIFDVQVKRLHEYKRQLLNALYILYLYFDVTENGAQIAPHTFIFGAKASPGYVRAKQTISLICAIADKVNSDPRVHDLIKVVFVENYGVSNAQLIIPAADISRQISLAGKEASGTGNMKFMMNGALTVGTMDGANVEMYNLVGADNIYIFGSTTDEINGLQRCGGYNPYELYNGNPRLKRVVDSLADGTLRGDIAGMKDYLINGSAPDPYYCLLDFADYLRACGEVEALYSDNTAWQKKALINIARSYYFSSDRSVREYNDLIWKLC